MAKYTLMKTEGRAKRAQFETVHGTIQTPVFMNVGTIGAIKGAVSTQDLYEIGTQVELSNTYHLHVRPGDKIVKQLGGLHKFMQSVVWQSVRHMKKCTVSLMKSYRIFRRTNQPTSWVSEHRRISWRA